MVRSLSVAANGLMSFAFIVMIALPAVAQFTGFNRTSVAENRELADFPEALDWREPERFTQAFDAYYQDHFGLRALLIETYARFRVFFRVSPSDKVVIGSDGWLFFNGNKVLENYRGLRPLKIYELERTRQHLEAKRDWLNARGIEYIYAVAPDKHTIYPEFLPGRIRQGIGPTRLEQLLDYLALHSDFQILDLRNALRVGKSRHRVYHKTDTHWNLHGARIGYKVIADRLRVLFPEFDPKGDEAYTVSWEAGEPGDLGRIIGIEGLYGEDQVNYKPRAGACPQTLEPEISPDYFKGAGVTTDARGCAEGQLQAVFFRDSFGNAMLQFLQEDLQRVDHVNRRFEQAAMEAYIARRKPDVVIEMYVERLMVRIARPEEIANLQAGAAAE